MRIELKCPCGAAAIFDDGGTRANPQPSAYMQNLYGANPTGPFVAQVDAEKWEKKHAECHKAYSAP